MSRNRFRLYFEPRDAWVGCYVAPTAIYVCLVPFVVLRWTRSAAAPGQSAGVRRAGDDAAGPPGAGDD